MGDVQPCSEAQRAQGSHPCRQEVSALARDVSSMAPSEAPDAPAGSGRTPSSCTGSDRRSSPSLPLSRPGKHHPGEGACEGALARFTELMRPVFYWNVLHYKVSIKYWLF